MTYTTTTPEQQWASTFTPAERQALVLATTERCDMCGCEYVQTLEHLDLFHEDRDCVAYVCCKCIQAENETNEYQGHDACIIFVDPLEI